MTRATTKPKTRKAKAETAQVEVEVEKTPEESTGNQAEDTSNKVQIELGKEWRALFDQILEETKALRAEISALKVLLSTSIPTTAPKITEAPEEVVNVQEVKPVPPEPIQDKAKAIDLASLYIDSLLAIVNAADTTQQVALVVDGAYGGEVWLDLREREQFINAVRMRYVSLSKLTSGGGRIPAFEKKMAEHVKVLEEEKHEEQEMRKWDEEERLREQLEAEKEKSK